MVSFGVDDHRLCINFCFNSRINQERYIIVDDCCTTMTSMTIPSAIQSHLLYYSLHTHILSLLYCLSLTHIALVTCNANVMNDGVIVNCPGIDGLPPGNNYQCSVDFAPPDFCNNLCFFVTIILIDLGVTGKI